MELHNLSTKELTLLLNKKNQEILSLEDTIKTKEELFDNLYDEIKDLQSERDDLEDEIDSMCEVTDKLIDEVKEIEAILSSQEHPIYSQKELEEAGQMTMFS